MPQGKRAAASHKVDPLNRYDTVMTGAASWIIQKTLKENVMVFFFHWGKRKKQKKRGGRVWPHLQRVASEGRGKVRGMAGKATVVTGGVVEK